LSRRKLLPFYLFTDPYQKDLHIKVQAAQWTHLNSHPHDGGLFKIVKPFLDKNGSIPKGICEICQKPLRDHGLIPDEQKVSSLERGYKICPGDWILLKHNDYWSCPQDLFDEIYQLLPREEWYEN
tara:strand:- start:265 stop:639 length:375 start_codon:yes stop_codon:yes gene_type:complete